LPLCSTAAFDDHERNCVFEDEVEPASELYKKLTDWLEVFQTCRSSGAAGPSSEATESAPEASGRSLAEIMSSLGQDSLTPKMLELRKVLVKILDENPDLGIRVVLGANDNEASLALIQPRQPWSCWFWEKVDQVPIL
jgi:hypothetical protein